MPINLLRLSKIYLFTDCSPTQPKIQTAPVTSQCACSHHTFGRKKHYGFAAIPWLNLMFFGSKIRWFYDKMAWIVWHWETCLMSAGKRVRSNLDPFLWGIFDSKNRESNSTINSLPPAINRSQKFGLSELYKITNVISCNIGQHYNGTRLYKGRIWVMLV